MNYATHVICTVGEWHVLVAYNDPYMVTDREKKGSA